MVNEKYVINHDFIRCRILEELEKYPKSERKKIKEATGLEDQYIRNMLQKGESRQDISFQALVAFSRVFRKPMEYFLYDESMFQDLVKEEFIKIPYIETFTDPENRLIYKNRYHMCAMRYDSLLKISNDPSRTILYVMDSDSMESTICKGDELLIDTTKKLVKDGAIYAFNSYDIKYIRIRRCFCEINTIQLIPDNDRKYGIYIAKNSDINIIGQVIMSKHFL